MNREFPAESLSISLRQGLQQLGIKPADNLIDAFLLYLQLLAQWNRAYNLTAIRDYPRMVSHLLLDSLAVLPYLHGTQCMDIGTGAGVPGMILALAEPQRHWILLDSNRKKVRFVNQVRLELAVANAETVCQRVESFTPQQPLSTVVCRAYAGLDKIVTQAGHLLSSETRLLAMKGADCAKEVQSLDTDTLAVQIHTYTVPGITEQRSLVEIRALPSSR